jgi:photosystem II stability/assembly factor-like uncharacterized protein
MTEIWNKQFHLKADRVNDCFYIFKNGSFWVSTDGGANWQVRGGTTLPNSSPYFLNVVTTPGKQGEVWITLDKKGLWKTSNGGKTFSKITAIDRAKLFSWGASAPNHDLPTAYCYGTIEGKWGLYRSVDMGKNWIRINDDEHQFLGHVSAIAGDRQEFGQIYIGTGGNGIFYGKLIS